MRYLPIVAVLTLAFISFTWFAGAQTTQSPARPAWEYATFYMGPNVGFSAGVIQGKREVRGENLAELYKNLTGTPLSPDKLASEADVLHVLGSDGWELVSVTDGPWTPTFYFKRPVR